MVDCSFEYLIPQDKKYNILIVEDSKFFNKKIHSILCKNQNFILSQAFDFEQASSFLKDKKYDFIILDLNLPDAFGENLLLKIKEISDAKIVVLTSQTDAKLREALFGLGIIEYIIKDKDIKSSIKLINRTISLIEKNRQDTILIVTDLQDMRNNLKNILTTREYKVIERTPTIEIKDISDKIKISTIIVDMQLHSIDSFDLLREIKEDIKLCNIPIISISNSNNPDDLSKSLKYGASYFIHQPFNIEEFTLKVDFAVEIYRKRVELLCSQTILQEYKDAVDESNIVSKTDLKGKITYVNKKFCEISGYSENELIGKPHNIIRHEDMSKIAFKELWETILKKESWSGIVKNRKKDGSAYFVQTTVKPILDYADNIIEFIAIRTDITQREKYKEILEKDLTISNNNLRYLSQYEEAISEFVAIFKTDHENYIIYINENFCKLSGYTKDELIGKKCSYIRAQKHVKRGDCDKLLNVLSEKKKVHMLFENVAKDGSTYFTDTKAFPLLDNDENVAEHLFLMYDVTEIVNIHTELEETQKDIIYKMGEIGESRSKETGNHVKRVANYSKILAKLVGLSEKDTEILYTASPMHDIGKVGIPDSILNKPGKLNESEWKVMKTHAKIGYDILKNSKREILKAAALISYTHHEKWDGTGYPRGLKAEQIDIFGRITALADVFDALGSDRVYKKAWKLEDIITLLKNEKGKHFDPKLVNLFLENLDQFLAIKEKYIDL